MSCLNHFNVKWFKEKIKNFRNIFFLDDHNFNVVDLGSQDQIQEIWNIDAKRDLMKLANIITSGKPA